MDICNNLVCQVIIALVFFGACILIVRWLWWREALRRHERGEDVDGYDDDDMEFRI